MAETGVWEPNCEAPASPQLREIFDDMRRKQESVKWEVPNSLDEVVGNPLSSIVDDIRDLIEKDSPLSPSDSPTHKPSLPAPRQSRPPAPRPPGIFPRVPPSGTTDSQILSPKLLSPTVSDRHSRFPSGSATPVMTQMNSMMQGASFVAEDSPPSPMGSFAQRALPRPSSLTGTSAPAPNPPQKHLVPGSERDLFRKMLESKSQHLNNMSFFSPTYEPPEGASPLRGEHQKDSRFAGLPEEGTELLPLYPVPDCSPNPAATLSNASSGVNPSGNSGDPYSDLLELTASPIVVHSPNSSASSSKPTAAVTNTDPISGAGQQGVPESTQNTGESLPPDSLPPSRSGSNVVSQNKAHGAVPNMMSVAMVGSGSQSTESPTLTSTGEESLPSQSPTQAPERPPCHPAPGTEIPTAALVQAAPVQTHKSSTGRGEAMLQVVCEVEDSSTVEIDDPQGSNVACEADVPTTTSTSVTSGHKARVGQPQEEAAALKGLLSDMQRLQADSEARHATHVAHISVVSDAIRNSEIPVYARMKEEAELCAQIAAQHLAPLQNLQQSTQYHPNSSGSSSPLTSARSPPLTSAPAPAPPYGYLPAVSYGPDQSRSHQSSTHQSLLPSTLHLSSPVMNTLALDPEPLRHGNPWYPGMKHHAATAGNLNGNPGPGEPLDPSISSWTHHGRKADILIQGDRNADRASADILPHRIDAERSSNPEKQ
eukprot:gene9403-1690_t